MNNKIQSGPYASRTHCPYDHEYTPENTYVTKRGHRQCKTCARESKLRGPRSVDAQPVGKPWNYRATPGCGLPGHEEDHFDSWGKKSCRQYHLERTRRYAKQRHERRKIAAMSAYGGCCACCGENVLVFLTVDHIDGNGGKHRRLLNASGSTTIYRWLEANGYPPGFQVLCWNCNLAKHMLGVCPHQTGGDANALSDVQSVHGSPV